MQVSVELHSLVFLSLGKEVWYPQQTCYTDWQVHVWGQSSTKSSIQSLPSPHLTSYSVITPLSFGGGEVTRLYLHVPIYLHGMQRDNFSLQSQNNHSMNKFTSGNWQLTMGPSSWYHWWGHQTIFLFLPIPKLLSSFVHLPPHPLRLSASRVAVSSDPAHIANCLFQHAI